MLKAEGVILVLCEVQGIRRGILQVLSFIAMTVYDVELIIVVTLITSFQQETMHVNI